MVLSQDSTWAPKPKKVVATQYGCSAVGLERPFVRAHSVRVRALPRAAHNGRSGVGEGNGCRFTAKHWNTAQHSTAGVTTSHIDHKAHPHAIELLVVLLGAESEQGLD